MAGAADPILGDLPVSNVELSLSCSNLKDLDHFSKSDPVVFVFEKIGNDWAKIGRTEVIMDNLNPEVCHTWETDTTKQLSRCYVLISRC